jgi:carbamoyl-phosphate synthase large subunit
LATLDCFSPSAQACKALKQLGYSIVLVNSNPATVMTDPSVAESTYVGPMTADSLERIIARERPDALLPTMGGQTALNLTKAVAEAGVLSSYGVELIGAKLDAINKAEDRQLFKDSMSNLGLNTPPSFTVSSIADAQSAAAQIGSFPLIIRPAFTLGGTGGGIAYNRDEFDDQVRKGLDASLRTQVLIEKSLLGWKEYELEVMRDLADNVVIVCTIENFDPMGVHTGDSVTVAPSQTLTDKEYQRLRDASIAIIREVGIECGGSNVQFAVNPEDGEVMVIEMNPRVSRSSALASKATGFPIAKIAAKLAVGLPLEHIPNDITRKTPASFEPSIDYVVTKVPRFAFEKFPGSVPVLNTQMRSVGEAMAIGRTFQESFQKSLRSLEMGFDGFGLNASSRGDNTGTDLESRIDFEEIRRSLRTPNPSRLQDIHDAMRAGMSQDEVISLTAVDPWFVSQLAFLVHAEQHLQSLPNGSSDLNSEDWEEIKRCGFSDAQLARALSDVESDSQVRSVRSDGGKCVTPSFKRVDTCAAEFAAETPYMYSSYEGDEDESNTTSKPKVLILGGGPNRIGQGIEFDYCCCHASYALQEAGYETIMMNSNPETVSTDYDTSDRLYFEPLTVEDVLNVIEHEQPEGIIVQFGGQTPLKIAPELERELAERPIHAPSGNATRIFGTSPNSIDAAEDRQRWTETLQRLGIEQPPGDTAFSESGAFDVAARLGYPVMVRPSYVLGGRAMEIVYSVAELERYMHEAVKVDPTQPVLIDKFLDSATELDVDALADSEGNVVIGGIMEHIERAGVHSGDSACSIPTATVPQAALRRIREWVPQIARELGVVGLINLQFAVRNDEAFIIEANPRASRTVPFVAKAVGHPLAKYASLVMSGQTLPSLGFTEEPLPSHYAVKEAVLPFDKFPGADTLLGPEMRSTGEVMGIDKDFTVAYCKAQIAAGQRIPTSGTVFVSVRDFDKGALVPVARRLLGLGLDLVATGGTASYLRQQGNGLEQVQSVYKIHEGRPHIGDMVRNAEVDLMIITAGTDEKDQMDGRDLRRMAVLLKVPIVTTMAGASATAEAAAALQGGNFEVLTLQSFFSPVA